MDQNALEQPRASVARAISDLQAFSGTAGSPEMRAVQNALDMLGVAYSCLNRPADNPAWDLD